MRGGRRLRSRRVRFRKGSADLLARDVHLRNVSGTYLRQERRVRNGNGSAARLRKERDDVPDDEQHDERQPPLGQRLLSRSTWLLRGSLVAGHRTALLTPVRLLMAATSGAQAR